MSNELLYKRIDTVYYMLEERQMSDWARNYWTQVLDALIRKHKRSMH
jgi:predicted cupin superfamily sugar epimerase